jgi:hypothetical protein
MGALSFENQIVNHKQASKRLKFCHQKEKGGIETKTVPYASIEIRQGKI